MSAGHLRLDCLGSSFAFSGGRYWSGYLLNGRVLLDCPPQTLAHLYRLGKSSAPVDLVLLSHEHSDHIFGMDFFLLDATWRQRPVRDRPFAVAGPPGIYRRLREVIGGSSRLPPIDDPYIEWFEPTGGETVEWDGVRAEAVEMQHVPDLVCLGYRVHIDGGVLAYTGDTAPGDHVFALAEGADALIVECGGHRGSGHFEWPDIFALREQLPASIPMLVTHYNPQSAPDVSSIEGLELAEDFATYEY